MNEERWIYLTQRYLIGKTNRDEERELLDECLKGINELLVRFRGWEKRKNEMEKILGREK